VAGVLIANLVFTFGPLHFNYFGLGTDAGPRWGMFGAIFVIGQFFGLVYQRSGNLWIPALLHGLWPLNMT
jgi:membrane protease YdiL (CAAX protease family)